jgi:hypothetical protein
MVGNLPPSSGDVTESGSLNLLEPSGPNRPVMGLLYFTRILSLPISISVLIKIQVVYKIYVYLYQSEYLYLYKLK